MSKRLRDVPGRSVYTAVQVPFAVEKMRTFELGAYLERAVRDARHYLKREMPICGDCERVRWTQDTSVSPKTLDREVCVKGECAASSCPGDDRSTITGLTIDRMWIDECEPVDGEAWLKMKNLIDGMKAKAFRDTPRSNPDRPLTPSAGDW